MGIEEQKSNDNEANHQMNSQISPYQQSQSSQDTGGSHLTNNSSNKNSHILQVEPIENQMNTDENRSMLQSENENLRSISSSSSDPQSVHYTINNKSAMLTSESHSSSSSSIFAWEGKYKKHVDQRLIKSDETFIHGSSGDSSNYQSTSLVQSSASGITSEVSHQNDFPPISNQQPQSLEQPKPQPQLQQQQQQQVLEEMKYQPSANNNEEESIFLVNSEMQNELNDYKHQMEKVEEMMEEEDDGFEVLL